MPSSATTWQQKLHECETESDSASRIGWLRKAYARIYRFLLSQYGATPPREVESPPMPFVDCTEELEGKAARSLGEIRHTLKHISANQPLDAIASAPREQEIWVTVAVEDKRLCVPACLEWLGRQGIDCRVVQEGRRRVVRVRREQAGEAFRLIARIFDLQARYDSNRASQSLSPTINPEPPVFADDATVQRRTELQRTQGQLGLIAFATSWGVLLCALVLKSSGNYPVVNTVILVSAVLAIVTLADYGLRLMRRR
jgi:hypothetical protein